MYSEAQISWFHTIPIQKDFQHRQRFTTIRNLQLPKIFKNSQSISPTDFVWVCGYAFKNQNKHLRDFPFIIISWWFWNLHHNRRSAIQLCAQQLCYTSIHAYLLYVNSFAFDCLPKVTPRRRALCVVMCAPRLIAPVALTLIHLISDMCCSVQFLSPKPRKTTISVTSSQRELGRTFRIHQIKCYVTSDTFTLAHWGDHATSADSTLRWHLQKCTQLDRPLIEVQWMAQNLDRNFDCSHFYGWLTCRP